MRRTLATFTAAGWLLVLGMAVPPVATPHTSPNHTRDPVIVATPPRGDVPSLFRGELEDPETLGVGRVATNVASTLPELDALARYLGEHVAGLGYARARPVIARDNDEMLEFLRRGIVDIVSETPLSAMHFVRGSGASILLRERRHGHAAYSSVLFVRDDSSIRSIADLPGHRIAFEDVGSTASFLLPLATLKASGLSTNEISHATDAVTVDEVGYFFVHSDKSIVTAVRRGVADAGAVTDEDWRTILDTQGNPAAFRLLQESQKIPRAFVLTGPGVTEEQARGLRRLLLSMADDPAGRDVLRRYDDVDGFDPIDDKLQHEIDRLRSTYDLVKDEMN